MKTVAIAALAFLGACASYSPIDVADMSCAELYEAKSQVKTSNIAQVGAVGVVGLTAALFIAPWATIPIGMAAAAGNDSGAFAISVGQVVKKCNGPAEFVTAASHVQDSEAQAWSKATRLGTMTAYQEFLRVHPVGKYADQAFEAMVLIRVNPRAGLKKAEES